MKKQTSVQYIQDNLSMNKTLGEIKIIIATALEMEKQQIEEAHIDGGKNKRTSIKYYNETFKK
jgi:2-iminoacetate synthase ThiH